MYTPTVSRNVLPVLVALLSILHASSQGIEPVNITIVRDAYGVPHIYGKTDAEAAYGLAWAHAEDDFESIQMNLLPGRGLAGSVQGKEGVLFDYALYFTGLDTLVPKLYESDLSPDFKKVLAGYSQGLNAFAAKYPQRVLHPKLFPVDGKDIIYGYCLKLSLMAGLGLALKSTRENRIEMFNAPNERGSNAIAVSADRMEDGKTLLVANSHQPIEGPFAWYEVHINSEEGWNMLGGLFPGGVTVFVGSNENLGWAHTNNYHTFGDIYKLETRGRKRYLYGGKWTAFRKRKARLKVKLGGIRLGITKTMYDSEFGPVFRSRHGFYAFRFPAYTDIRAAEQWYRMNKAKDREDFEAALRMDAIPMFNFIYADRANNILMHSGGKIPKRDTSLVWKQPIDGTNPRYRWNACLGYDEKLSVWNPPCGYVFNANNTPLHCTGPSCDWKGSFVGLQLFENNRGNIFARHFENHPDKFTDADIRAVKYDKSYSFDGVYDDRFKNLYRLDEDKYPKYRQAIRMVKAWDRDGDVDDSTAALMLVIHKSLTKKLDGPFAFLMIREDRVPEADAIWAVKKAQRFLLRTHGTLKVPLGQVQRHIRGTVNLPAGGLSEVPRATDAKLWDRKKGIFRVTGGDGYIQFAKFSPSGTEIRSVNAYGASAQKNSPHYTDQMELFLREGTKPMSLDKATVFKTALSIYHPE